MLFLRNKCNKGFLLRVGHMFTSARTDVKGLVTESGKLFLSLSSSKSTFSQTFNDKCISEVARIGSVIIFHLSK